MRYDANDVIWKVVEVKGKKCLFSKSRIYRDTIHKDYYMYEVRHSDLDWGEPIEICFGVLVNFYGTLLTKEPFEFDEDGWLDIDCDEDWFWMW